MDRALRRVERAHELGERHARLVDDLFEDARDAIDRAVVLAARPFEGIASARSSMSGFMLGDVDG